MVEKLNLKGMGKKQLRKVAKAALKEVARLGTYQVELRRQIDVWKEKEISWKEYLDAEVYYKKEAMKDAERKGEYINRLQFALSALGYDPRGMDLDKAVELGVATGYKMIRLHWLKNHPEYIGEMPSNLNMGVDGQLKEETYLYPSWCLGGEYKKGEIVHYENRYYSCIEDDNNSLVNPRQSNFWLVVQEPEEDEFGPNFLAEEVQEEQRIDLLGSIFGVPSGSGKIVPTKLNTEDEAEDRQQEFKEEDAAVAWAERNGHHQPKGNPEPNKMESVRVKSAEEISVENREKHEKLEYSNQPARDAFEQLRDTLDSNGI